MRLGSANEWEAIGMIPFRGREAGSVSCLFEEVNVQRCSEVNHSFISVCTSISATLFGA